MGDYHIDRTACTESSALVLHDEGWDESVLGSVEEGFGQLEGWELLGEL